MLTRMQRPLIVTVAFGSALVVLLLLLTRLALMG